MKKIVITNDYQLSKVQDAAADAFDKLPTSFPILSSNIVKVASTSIKANTDFSVQHGLARAPNGWIVVRKDAKADVWESGSSNPRPNEQFIYQASAPANLTFYFF